MNFVFISPNFPRNYWNFCRALKNNNVNVLGIGDEVYDSLSQDLKNSLTEYYKVSSLENYDEVHKACQFFTDKYGHIDWLESNNEYWLLKDAALRTDFDISTGLKSDKVGGIKYKSKMKEYYEKAGVLSARYHLVTTYDEGLKFIRKVGYPVIVKPDNGVGAAATYKISNNAELKAFYNDMPNTQYIMEEYVNGDLLSFDGVAGRDKKIIFKTAHAYPVPIMELVNDHLDVMYYSLKEIPHDLEEAGQKVVASFETENRFFHCEFFRLLENKRGLGKKGDIVGLEVNMRPPGGFTPDMMNYANDIDVYQIWANMVCYDEGRYNTTRPYSCVYAARRDALEYVHTKEETLEKYGPHIVMKERMPEVLAAAMGDDMLTARFSTEDESRAFADFYLEKK